MNTTSFVATKVHLLRRVLLPGRYKSSLFIWFRYWGWKVDTCWKSQAKKIMGRCYCKKTILRVWWYSETFNTKRYQQQLIDLNRSLLRKQPEYQKQQHKGTFLHVTPPFIYIAKPTQDGLQTHNWKSASSGCLLTLPDCFCLPVLCIDGSGTC